MGDNKGVKSIRKHRKSLMEKVRDGETMAREIKKQRSVKKEKKQIMLWLMLFVLISIDMSIIRNRNIIKGGWFKYKNDSSRNFFILSHVLGRILEHAHDIIVSIDPVLLLISQLYPNACVQRQQHSLSRLHLDLSQFAIAQLNAWSRWYHLSVLALRFVLLRDQNAAPGLGQSFRTLDQHSVGERHVSLEIEHHLRYMYGY